MKPDTDTTGPAPRDNSAVRAIDLSKVIDDRLILHEVNLDIPQGRFVVILGANGAGKSTLLKTLATLTRPTSGHLSLFGHSVQGDAGGTLSITAKGSPSVQ